MVTASLSPVPTIIQRIKTTHLHSQDKAFFLILSIYQILRSTTTSLLTYPQQTSLEKLIDKFRLS